MSRKLANTIDNFDYSSDITYIISILYTHGEVFSCLALTNMLSNVYQTVYVETFNYSLRFVIL